MRLVPVALLFLTLSSCALEWNGLGPADAIASSLQLTPENRWNVCGVWKRVEDNPPTYLPTDCPTSVPRDSSRGQWVTDKRDGKRFFIPAGGTEEFKESVLLCDARKQCDPPPALIRKSRSGSRSGVAKSTKSGFGGFGLSGIGKINVGKISIPCNPSIPGSCAPKM